MSSGNGRDDARGQATPRDHGASDAGRASESARGGEGDSHGRDERAREDRRLLSNLGRLLSGEPLRRGTEVVSDLTSATKDEVMRLVGAEVRSMLDRIDVADIAQQVLSGLVIDVEMKVKFSRDESGRTRLNVRGRRDEGARESTPSATQAAASSSPSAADPTRDDPSDE